ncbi:hypothetical protein P8452_42700 [Trifolium repens]|nr:hypothetical protein P8452_42700 [Trifolium repens]
MEAVVKALDEQKVELEKVITALKQEEAEEEGLIAENAGVHDAGDGVDAAVGNAEKGIFQIVTKQQRTRPIRPRFRCHAAIILTLGSITFGLWIENHAVAGLLRLLSGNFMLLTTSRMQLCCGFFVSTRVKAFTLLLDILAGHLKGLSR